MNEVGDQPDEAQSHEEVPHGAVFRNMFLCTIPKSDTGSLEESVMTWNGQGYDV